MDNARRFITALLIFSSTMMLLVVFLSTIDNIIQGLEFTEIIYYPTTRKEIYAFTLLLGYSAITTLLPGIWLLNKSKLPYQALRSSISVSIGSTAGIVYLVKTTETDLSHINEQSFYLVIFLTLLISSIITNNWWNKPNKLSKRDAVTGAPS